jgi:FAD/FMN-containing dehydrogenase
MKTAAYSSDPGRRAYPPATLERLAEVKRRYDPDNVFRLSVNVAPLAP